MIARLTWRVALFGSLLLVAHCAPPPPPPPAALVLTIDAGAKQNPDPSGHPTSVAIRLYQLGSTGAFERADVFPLAEHEAATLGADDLGSEEFLVAPGEHRTIRLSLKTGVRSVGVVVLFRDIDHATWRAEAPAAASGPTRLVLRTKGVVATLAPTPAGTPEGKADPA